MTGIITWIKFAISSLKQARQTSMNKVYHVKLKKKQGNVNFCACIKFVGLDVSSLMETSWLNEFS